MHTDRVGHHCHYFNNDKMCPFEELGCKFFHTDSKKCKFGLTCQRMCPFKHVRVNNNEVTETNIDNSRIGKNEEDEKNETMADDGLFMTSTAQKIKYDCEECQNQTQCTDCFLRQDQQNEGFGYDVTNSDYLHHDQEHSSNSS